MTIRYMFPFICVALTGCASIVELRPDEVDDVVYEFTAEGRASTHGVEVRQGQDPHLLLETTRMCGIGEVLTRSCRAEVYVPLRDATGSGDAVTVKIPTATLLGLYDEETFTTQEITRAELRYGSDTLDPEWDPWGAAGVMVFGPSGFAGFHFHLFPHPALALDTTFFAAPGFGAAASLGLRFRPVAFGPMRPFIGASTSNYITAGQTVEDGDIESFSALVTAVRTGLDIEFADRRGLLGLELDLQYNLADQRVGFFSPKAWTPFGGAYVAYQF